MRSSSEAGTPATPAPPFPPPGSAATLGRTWTSMPPVTLAKDFSRTALVVSVSTSVPDTNPTPSMTATPVSSTRSLCASRPLTVWRSISASLRARGVSRFRGCSVPGAPQPLDPVQHPFGGGTADRVHDAAVGQEQGLVGVAGGDRVVGDHHDGLLQLIHRAAQELEQLRAGAGVQ